MFRGKRYTTVNTDAGVKNGIAVYGYWIRSEKQRVIISNQFKLPKKDANEAELAAILTALIVVVKDKYLGTANVIVVNTDSKYAISMLKKNKISKESTYYEEWNNIRSHFKKHHIKFTIRWVKGHSKGETAREWINNFIDKHIRIHYKK